MRRAALELCDRKYPVVITSTDLINVEASNTLVELAAQRDAGAVCGIHADRPQHPTSAPSMDPAHWPRLVEHATIAPPADNNSVTCRPGSVAQAPHSCARANRQRRRPHPLDKRTKEALTMYVMIHLSNGSVGELAGAIVVRTSDPSVFDHGVSIDDLIRHRVVRS